MTLSQFVTSNQRSSQLQRINMNQCSEAEHSFVQFQKRAIKVKTYYAVTFITNINTHSSDCAK